MKTFILSALFLGLGLHLSIKDKNEYENMKAECSKKNERVLKVKSYLACIK